MRDAANDESLGSTRMTSPSTASPVTATKSILPLEKTPVAEASHVSYFLTLYERRDERNLALYERVSPRALSPQVASVLAAVSRSRVTMVLPWWDLVQKRSAEPLYVYRATLSSESLVYNHSFATGYDPILIVESDGDAQRIVAVATDGWMFLREEQEATRAIEALESVAADPEGFYQRVRGCRSISSVLEWSSPPPEGMTLPEREDKWIAELTTNSTLAPATPRPPPTAHALNPVERRGVASLTAELNRILLGGMTIVGQTKGPLGDAQQCEQRLMLLPLAREGCNARPDACGTLEEVTAVSSTTASTNTFVFTIRNGAKFETPHSCRVLSQLGAEWSESSRRWSAPRSLLPTLLGLFTIKFAPDSAEERVLSKSRAKEMHAADEDEDAPSSGKKGVVPPPAGWGTWWSRDAAPPITPTCRAATIPQIPPAPPAAEAKLLIVVTVVGQECVVTGKTYEQRRGIAAVGGVWNKEKKAWIAPLASKPALDAIAQRCGYT
jgi:hypothetical protein